MRNTLISLCARFVRSLCARMRAYNPHTPMRVRARVRRGARAKAFRGSALSSRRRSPRKGWSLRLSREKRHSGSLAQPKTNMGLAERDLRVATSLFSQGGVVDMGSIGPDQKEIGPSGVEFGAPGAHRWWEDESRPILVFSKSEMAECCQVSLKTVDSWIRKGAPVFQQGASGKSYQLDAVAFVEWVRAFRGGISIDELRHRDEVTYCEHLHAELKRLGRG